MMQHDHRVAPASAMDRAVICCRFHRQAPPAVITEIHFGLRS